MDLSADSGTLLTHPSGGGPDVEREPPAFNTAHQTESVSLHLLEFRICLLEAVEELHIRRGAETRLEDQISKLVVEKQELEWQKESLQHQIEMLTNQHTESFTGVKKEFQAKIKAIEEEKGKHQLSAELKDKEINSLKEELKSLQLFKYSLEKKSSELEQKLALQSHLKDSHLKQLGEVEKCFSALCRKCAVLKKAHDKLEQNVAEAMRVNMQLNSANEKQETAISSLKQEAEELNNQVMKAKVLSAGLCEASDHSATEQHVQQLQHRLLMETELTRKVTDENAAERTEKQKVMRSLQHAQLLLLSQTQLVSRVEQELHTQKQENLALKREHEVMREKSKAAEDKLAQLMEDYATSKTIWDKEKRDLQAVTEAYDQLQQKHTELSSQAALQAQYIQELETRGYSHSRSVSDLLSLSSVRRTKGEGLLNEANTSSELPVPGSLQSLAPAQTRDPDGLLVTEAVDKLVTTGVTGGPETSIHCQEPQCKQSPIPSNLVTTLLTTSLFSPQTLCGATGNKINSLSTYLPISNTSENDRALVSDLTNIMSDGGLLISGDSSLRTPVSVSSLKNGCVYEDADALNGGKNDGVNRGNSQQEGGKDGVKEGKETVIEDGEEAEEEGGRLVMQTPGREILTQMSTDIEHSDEEKSEPPQAADSMDAEMPPAASQPTDGSHILPQKELSATDPDTNHMKEGHLIGLEGGSVETLPFEDVQTITQEPQPHSHEAQQLSYNGQQGNTHDVESLSQMSASRQQGFEKTTEEKTSQETEAHFPSAPSNPLNQSNVNSSQTHTALSDTQTDDTQLPSSHTSDINMKSTDEHGDTHSSEECVAVGRMAELHVLHLSKETSEQENEPTAPDCGEYEKNKSLSKVNIGEKDASEIAQQPVGKTSSTDSSLLHDVGSQASALFVCSVLSESGSAAETSTANTVANEETGGHQENMKNKTENVEGVEVIQNKQNLKVPDGSPERDAETGSSKCNDKPLAKETDHSSLLSNKKHRSCFEWAGTQRKKASSMSELNTSGSGAFPGRPCTSTIPALLKGKLNKDPSVVISASDLLNASSISGPTSSFKRDQQGEYKAIRETFREAAAPDTESRVALSTGCSPVSTSSSAVSRLSWQTTSGSNKTATPVQGSGSDWFPSSSQGREEQSLRAQISRIEQFLCAERLRLPKRPRTDS